MLSRPGRLPFVLEIKGRSRSFLYYRREGRQIALAAPEGSAAFLHDYDAAHATFETVVSPWNKFTLGRAIEDYLTSADYLSLRDSTRANYKRQLDRISSRSGQVYIEHIDLPWMEALRDRFSKHPERWNTLRSRMLSVFNRYMRSHPDRMKHNPWLTVKRLKVKQSNANRAWPDDVLIKVLRAATPEFRALLLTLLLTAQRLSDVCAMTPSQYDRALQQLTLAQLKTGKPQVLHVPQPLSEVFDAMSGRAPGYLLVSPRGKHWKPVNAEATLLVMRRHLALERYTLHGLRATGPTALKTLGFENRSIRALSGHDSDRNLEIYLRGVATYPLARKAQDSLADRYENVMATSLKGANNRRFSGVTGRAAASNLINLANTRGDDAAAQARQPAKQVQSAKRPTGQ